MNVCRACAYIRMYMCGVCIVSLNIEHHLNLIAIVPFDIIITTIIIIIIL